LIYRAGEFWCKCGRDNCKYWNKHEGGEEQSFHLVGLAVDILCTDSQLRYRVVKAAINLGVTGIGIGRTFIHLDCGHPVSTIFVYSMK
jgi:uncharacterized protein YcbK (DUF882 family)